MGSIHDKEPLLAALWDTPVTVQRNHFIHKSLSSFACNLAVGCGHGCRFCSVPDTSAVKLSRLLGAYGVGDAVADWGRYQFPQPWDEWRFLASLAKAEAIPPAELNADGHRAVFFCSTTEPFPTILLPDKDRRRRLQMHAHFVVRRALELIRDRSTLNVRILTRSPLALQHLALLRSFGPRLLLGASIPTLNNRLAAVYEGRSPAPSQRLAMLGKARDAGVPVYVAVAPFFPESGDDDLRNTFAEIAKLDPATVFFEPINVRLGNIERMEAAARRAKVKLRLEVFQSPASWRKYALDALRRAEAMAAETELADRLHLWPDPDLGSKIAISEQVNREAYQTWLHRCWSRVSEWPASHR